MINKERGLVEHIVKDFDDSREREQDIIDRIWSSYECWLTEQEDVY